MRMLILLVAVAFVAMFLMGCTSAGVQSPTGFSAIIGPVFYTNATFPSQLQRLQLDNRKYKVLGKAHGFASTRSLFFMFGFGDGGVNSAIKDSLTDYREADDLMDVRVDTEAFNVFFMYTVCTTHVYGKAIKYTDNGEVK